ncbi:MAG: hypothetical protein HFJ27_04280 [Clostridia bacterium]|nr:hypothetical protein [Clostridia bacterium]
MMKSVEDEVVKEIVEKYGVKEEFVKLLIKICADNHILNTREELNTFFNNNY